MKERPGMEATPLLCVYEWVGWEQGGWVWELLCGLNALMRTFILKIHRWDSGCGFMFHKHFYMTTFYLSSSQIGGFSYCTIMYTSSAVIGCPPFKKQFTLHITSV